MQKLNSQTPAQITVFFILFLLDLGYISATYLPTYFLQESLKAILQNENNLLSNNLKNDNLSKINGAYLKFLSSILDFAFFSLATPYHHFLLIKILRLFFFLA